MELGISLLTATGLGLLTGLGIGGGSLLLLYLTLVLHMDPGTARTLSLLFFFPAALVSCFRRGSGLSLKELLPAVLWGILAAALFSGLSRILDPGYLKKAMGLLFLLTGLSELLHRPASGRTNA